LTGARLGARPAPQQQVYLLVAADKRGQRRSTQRFEAALNDARTQYLPSRHRHSDTLDLNGPDIPVFEKIADQPARARGNDNSVRLGQRLKTGGEVRRLANDGLLLGRACANQIAYDHEPGSDADARLELDRFDVKTADGVDQTQPGSDGPLRVIFMRPRIAKIGQHAVAHEFGNKTVKASDDIGDSTLIRS